MPEAYPADRYEQYEEEPDSRRTITKPRKGVAPKRNLPAPELPGFQSADEVVMTYRPGRIERQWLAASLVPFYDGNLITDVLSLVRGGKEANVYLCAAHPTLGVELAAAKVYRPRRFRNLRNDAIYREGRPLLTEDGRPAKRSDHRIIRAVGKRTAFGEQVRHTSWLMHEYNILALLSAAGASVPQPFGACENALLMAYCGDRYGGAPTLSQIELEPDEAARAFRDTIRTMELMLSRELVHGDLSAFNLLYWNSAVTVIDFPQVVDAHVHRYAYPIFERDVVRVCEYFRRQGVPARPELLAPAMWRRCIERGPAGEETGPV
jgi:RIO kinase 1